MANVQLDAEVADSPLYWLFVLETAREANDYPAAAEADKELKRLGIVVKHTRRRKKKGAGDEQ